MANKTGKEVAVFAGGCFWCMDAAFGDVEGVLETSVGYTGGKEQRPNYEEVSGGGTGHVEAIQIIYDPHKVNYEQLLEIYWQNIDPTQLNGQFADLGPQYQTAIFYGDENQKAAAEKSKQDLIVKDVFGDKIVTRILPAGKFWPAEEYHQEYYKKNPSHYSRYKTGSGRSGFLEKTWGKHSG